MYDQANHCINKFKQMEGSHKDSLNIRKLIVIKKKFMVNNPVIRVYRSYIKFIYLNMSDNFRILVLLKTCNVFQYFMTHIINESY